MMNSPASWLKDPWSTAAAWFHSRPSDDCGQILSVSTYLAKPNTGSPSHTNPPSLYSADCFLLMPSHHPYPQLIIHPFSSTSRIYQRSHLSRITASCLLLKTLLPNGTCSDRLFKSLLHLDSSNNVFFSLLSAAPPTDPIGVMSPIQRQPISLPLESGINL